MGKTDNKDTRFVIQAFLVWRIFLFAILFLAVLLLPNQARFLGGGPGDYLNAPWIWAWANFDGEHYLTIAQNGYGFGQHSFFPLYPFFIRLVGNLLGGSHLAFNVGGLLISNLSFLFALLGFYKLARLDFSEKKSKMAVILLLIFPTSFYFGSVYTESLFLALVVWSFYLARGGKLLYACLIAMLASAARFIGILLFPALLVGLLGREKIKSAGTKYLYLIFIPLGLFAYMFFLYKSTGDAFAFFRELSSFGEQRSATPILLPQVFFRYIFRILPNVNYAYFPAAFVAIGEFLVGGGFLILAILAFRKLKLEYATFLAFGYLAPTLSGSFSSFPRYVSILFPAFLLAAIYFVKLPKIIQVVFVTVLVAILAVSTALFIRGYWIS